MRKNVVVIFLYTLVMLAGCSDPGVYNKDAVSTEETDYLITITTEYGEMKAILYDQTPKHKANFVKLAQEGFYDGLLFHRVIEDFMIQGGDPDSRLSEPEQQLGNGGPGYEIPAEIVPGLFHVKGALAAARRGDKENPERASSGSQFYIVQGKVLPKEQLEGVDRGKVYQAYQTLMSTMPEHELAIKFLTFKQQNPEDRQGLQNLVMGSADQLASLTGYNFTMSPERVAAYASVGGTPFLDGQYSIFGQVIEGLDVIDTIASAETTTGDRPTKDVQMSITVAEVPKTSIPQLIEKANMRELATLNQAE